MEEKDEQVEAKQEHSFVTNVSIVEGIKYAQPFKSYNMRRWAVEIAILFHSFGVLLIRIIFLPFREK